MSSGGRTACREDSSRCPMGEIWAAHKQGREGREILVLKGREQKQIAILASFLPEAGMADSILEKVRERISLLPDGHQRLEDIASRQAVVERIVVERPAVSLALCAFLVLVFLAELATGAFADPFRLLAFGANSYPLVKNGELFRLATANLLHGNLIHISFNAMALFNLGSFLEPLLGRWRFLTIFLVSALAGAAGSAFLGHHVLALGASTGIAGLIAAYIVVLWRWPGELSNPPTKKTWIWLAFVFLSPAFFVQNVDNLGHLGGFLAGLLLFFPEIRTSGLKDLANRRRTLFRGIAVLLVALFLAASVIAFRQASDPEHDLKVASVLLRDTSLDPAMVNEMAWKVASSPASSRDVLALALRRIERAVASAPGGVEIRDTQATLLYRLGRWEEAVRTELGVVAASKTPLLLSQLARFEGSLARARGPLVLGRPPIALPRAQIVSGSSILIDVTDPHPLAGTLFHVVLSNSKKTSGLLELTVGTAETSGPLRYQLPQDLSPLPDEASLTLVDTRKSTGVPSETQWSFQPMIPEIARLP
jgi:rhomboid protease GluP